MNDLMNDNTVGTVAGTRYPGKDTGGSRDSHGTPGHTCHTGVRGHTDHTDEPHNHPNTTTARPRDGVATAETAADSTADSTGKKT